MGKYAELLGLLENIPKQLEGMSEVSEQKIIQALPKMIREAFPELLEILSLGSGIPKEEIEQFGLTDVARIVQAIFEVNEFSELGKVLEAMKIRPKLNASNPTNNGLKE